MCVFVYIQGNNKAGQQAFYQQYFIKMGDIAENFNHLSSFSVFRFELIPHIHET